MIALPDRRRDWVIAPVAATLLAVLAIVIGWKGVDLPASIYRVGLFHRAGLTLWDSQWYSGHWTFSYSVIYPLVAGILGVYITEVASAAVGAWAFERLVVSHFGPVGRTGSLVFAVGTLAQVAIGQLPFLLGEALGLVALWAATRRRWPLAVGLAFCASLASPLAGAFLGLAVVAWLLATWPEQRLPLLGVGGAAGLPLLAVGVLFPGQGAMPFPAIDFVWLLIVSLAVLALLPRHERALRIGLGLYVLALAASFALPSAMGSNVIRLAACIGAPLVACVALQDRRRLMALAVVPLVLLQWTPAVATFTSNKSDASTGAAYFRPLLAFMAQHSDPPGRLEIVATQLHWEAAYVAPHVALARGWDRQLDTADNPIFYDQNALNPSSYQTWLLNNGVRYVALPDVPLDYAAVKEARLIDAGVPGLRLVWEAAHWQVFELTGAPGIISGPAQLVRLDGGHVALNATDPGTILVRVRYSPRWTLVRGQGCVQQAPGGSTVINARTAGELQLDLRLLPSEHGEC